MTIHPLPVAFAQHHAEPLSYTKLETEYQRTGTDPMLRERQMERRDDGIARAINAIH